MAIESPFRGLQIDKEVVCDFLAVFSRFEFVLKEERLVLKSKAYASPDWGRFARDAAKWLKVQPGSEVAAAVAYLNDEPPEVQDRELVWRKKSLQGTSPVERAFHSVRRVRNNLFHGGKHTPHSPPGRDQKLVGCSLVLLAACLDQNDNIRTVFEQIEF